MANHADTTITLTDAPGDDERAVIMDGLRAYNDAQTGASNRMGWRETSVDEHRGKPGYRKFYRPYPEAEPEEIYGLLVRCSSVTRAVVKDDRPRTILR